MNLKLILQIIIAILTALSGSVVGAAYFANSAAKDVKLVGPVSVAAYKPVIFTLDGLPAKTPVIWDVLPEDKASIVEVGPNGLHVWLEPGAYKLKARFLQAGAFKTIRQDFVVDPLGPKPPVPPGPNPPGPTPPGPTPPGPNPPGPTPPQPGRFDLAKLANSEASKLPAEAKAKAPQLAKALHTLATAVRAGTNTTRKDFDRVFNEAVGDQLMAWAAPKFVVANKVLELNKAGKIVNSVDLGDAYDEVAQGLESVK